MDLSPEEIAYIHVLNKQQAMIVLGDKTNHGVLYVTTVKQKLLNGNVAIQNKIKQLRPDLRCYLG